MRFACRIAVICWLVFLGSSAGAQKRGEPGQFDFYLLNLSWSPEFCAIHETSPQCAAHPGFVVHGLWPQNNDGSYPALLQPSPGPGAS